MAIDSMAAINAIKPVDLMGSFLEDRLQTQEGAASFSDLFSSAIAQTEQAQAVTREQTDQLLMGQVNNLHDLPIASTKAELALNLTIQIRNKAIDAYNELMRMQV